MTSIERIVCQREGHNLHLYFDHLPLKEDRAVWKLANRWKEDNSEDVDIDHKSRFCPQLLEHLTRKQKLLNKNVNLGIFTLKKTNNPDIS